MRGSHASIFSWLRAHEKKPFWVHLGVSDPVSNPPLVTILTTQVGEFYETLGPDAVLLCQHCNLNPMGQRQPPQAGFPIANLDRTLRDLLSAGFSMVRKHGHITPLLPCPALLLPLKGGSQQRDRSQGIRRSC